MAVEAIFMSVDSSTVLCFFTRSLLIHTSIHQTRFVTLASCASCRAKNQVVDLEIQTHLFSLATSHSLLI